MRRIIEEVKNAVKNKWALDKASKLLDKKGVEDYAILVRTQQSSYIKAKSCYGDILDQVVTIILQIAAANKINIKEVMEDIDVRIYQKKLLQIEINELEENRDSYTQKEYQEELEKILEKYNIAKTEEELESDNMEI